MSGSNLDKKLNELQNMDPAELDGLDVEALEQEFGGTLGDAHGKRTPTIDDDAGAGAADDTGDDADAAGDTKAKTGQDDKKGAEPSDAQAAGEDGDDVDPDNSVVKTADGKHEIPYSVLQKARQSQRDAEVRAEQEKARADELQRELEESKNQSQQLEAKAGVDTTDGDAEGKVRLLTDDEKQKLRDEYPDDIADQIISQNGIIVAQQNQLDQMATSIKTLESDRTVGKARSVQEAIDSIPLLTELQADGGPMWDAACALDDKLRADPDWKDKTSQERFEEVAKRMEDQMRAYTGQKSPAGAPTKAKGTDVDKKVDQALAAADKKATPGSHSDLAGGEAPDQSEQARVEGLDSVQLETMFDGKSPEQIDAILARIGG